MDRSLEWRLKEQKGGLEKNQKRREWMDGWMLDMIPLYTNIAFSGFRISFRDLKQEK